MGSDLSKQMSCLDLSGMKRDLGFLVTGRLEVQSPSTCCLYILNLAEGKRYVGRVDTPEDVKRRYNEHATGKGSAWTKMYPPVGIEQTIANSDIFDEDAQVLKLMWKYGMDNVRGGSYSQITLGPEQIQEIERKINGATDKCFRCGGNHFVKDCRGDKKSKVKKDKPKRHMYLWSDAEENKLLNRVKSGRTHEDIAKEFERTTRAIKCRLLDIAGSMYVKDVPIDNIMKVTGLSRKAIEKKILGLQV